MLLQTPRIDAQRTAASRKVKRNAALDFTKGALVLIMVLYHWINYFIGPQWGYYRYLRFLTPSFIFISGFIVSNIYLSKFDVADPRLPKRLFTRGFKLLVIFLFLNVARTYIVPILGTGVIPRKFVDIRDIFNVFISGNVPIAGGKLISFYILVPISYLLMFAAVLMLPHRFYRYTFHIVCVLLLTVCVAAEFKGVQSPNLELVTIGMLGLLSGFASIASINQFVQHPFMLGIAYLGYTIAISIWNVPFSLQAVGVPLSVIVIYLIGDSGNDSSRIRSEVILLGKYSLFGYISQIAILQILYAGLRQLNSYVGVQLISFVAAFSLTIISVEAIDRARSKALIMDKLYKAVFA